MDQLLLEGIMALVFALIFFILYKRTIYKKHPYRKDMFLIFMILYIVEAIFEFGLYYTLRKN